jgi:hypothetical protein
MKLNLEELPFVMIDFINATIDGTPPETAFRLVREAGSLNTECPLLMEYDDDLDDDLVVEAPLARIVNDPWLVVGQMMEWAPEMELPTLHQICFFVGTLRTRRQHTEWEREHVAGFRGMVAKLFVWHDRADETAHPNAYRVACWLAINAIIITTERRIRGTTDPWNTSRLDLNGLRAIYERIPEMKHLLLRRLGMYSQRLLIPDKIRDLTRHIASLVWPGFENHETDDWGEPLNEEGYPIDILTGEVLPVRENPPERSIDETLAGLTIPPEYATPKKS